MTAEEKTAKTDREVKDKVMKKWAEEKETEPVSSDIDELFTSFTKELRVVARPIQGGNWLYEYPDTFGGRTQARKPIYKMVKFYVTEVRREDVARSLAHSAKPYIPLQLWPKYRDDALKAKAAAGPDQVSHSDISKLGQDATLDGHPRIY